ncbi:MAG: hypothetical protein ACXWQO_08155, partial [Bdellovibrionota bacterium]
EEPAAKTESAKLVAALPSSPNFVPEVRYAYPSQKERVFDGSKFGHCLANVTAKDFPKFSFDRSQMKCTWNVQGEPYEYTRSDKPDFMHYLSGRERKCDYVSGQEEELKKWITAQPDNSINPLALYRQSLTLNQGNIWNALLAIHQVMRQEARFYDYVRYNYKGTAAESEAFFNKFVDIRGDLKERGGSFTGDHAGTWYRIWGAMLFRLMPFDKTDFQLGLDTDLHSCKDELALGHSQVELLKDDLTAMMVFLGDEVILKMHVEDDKMGKFHADLNASNSMGPLFQDLTNPGKLAKRSDKELESCLAGSYLQVPAYYDLPETNP